MLHSPHILSYSYDSIPDAQTMASKQVQPGYDEVTQKTEWSHSQSSINNEDKTEDEVLDDSSFYEEFPEDNTQGNI